MSRNKNMFDIRIKHDDIKIIDQKVNNLKEADNLFSDFKKKFR